MVHRLYNCYNCTYVHIFNATVFAHKYESLRHDTFCCLCFFVCSCCYRKFWHTREDSCFCFLFLSINLCNITKVGILGIWQLEEDNFINFSDQTTLCLRISCSYNVIKVFQILSYMYIGHKVMHREASGWSEPVSFTFGIKLM